MKRIILGVGVALMGLLLVAGLVSGEIPHLMNFQGRLTDASGNPLTGNYNITFRIYSVPSGGTTLWTETQTGVSVTNGIFNVLLGSVTEIPATAFEEKDRYLGIKVGADPEMIPRQRITSVGYAFSADRIKGSNIFPSSGNVGIGTTTPGAKLDVQGQIIGGFGAQTTGGTKNWNDTTNARSGSGYTLLHGNATNGPGPGYYYHPFSFEYSSKSGLGNMTQFAIPYYLYDADNGTNIYFRNRYSASWGSWAKIITTNPGETKTIIPGNVGIGTTAPGAKLDVVGNIRLSGWAPRITVPVVDRWPGLTIATSLTLETGSAGAGDGNIYISPGYNGYLDTYWSVILNKDGGNVGIGTTSPGHPLHMGSGAHCTSGGVWTNASSKEYKENIRELPTEEAISALGQLKPVKFNYKTDKEDEYLGFIGEDVPELVATKDRKGLSPMDIIAVLTAVAKEQQQRISALEKEIKKLKK